MSTKVDPAEFDTLCQEYMTSLYHGVSGFISYQPGEKETGEKSKVYLTYGEMLYPSVNILIEYIDIKEDDVFYDLGSGVGKVPLHFFLKSPIKKAAGVEFSKKRHDFAVNIFSQVKQEFSDLFAGGRELESFCANFLEFDMSDATIVYACSTCFSEELLSDIGKMLNEKCPKLRYLLTNKQIASKLPYDTALDVECTWDKTKWHVYGPAEKK